MIISIGARADIVHRYPQWLNERFCEGYVYTRNPLFPNRITRYLLQPDKVDAVVFCSKHYRPFFPYLERILSAYRTYFQYTITAYGEDLEPNIPSIDERIETLKVLSQTVGKARVVWRYDPVLLTPTYTAERHKKTFAMLAGQLAPYVDRCIFSFVETHAKLKTNIPQLLPLSPAEKHSLAEAFAKIAKRAGFMLQTCGRRDTFPALGIASEGCVTLHALGAANRCVFRETLHRGNRRGCLCIESREIGWYDACPNLCRYCYANPSAAAVEENIKLHDPHSPLLIGTLRRDDILFDGIQTGYLKNDGRQISLFDL